MAKRISTAGIPGKSGFKARTKARYENLVNGGKT